MNAAHRVIKNTGILYARMVITVILSLYTTRLTLDALGVEDFGIFNLVGGAIAMLTFLNASMASATQRFMSFAQGQGDDTRQLSIFNVSMLMHMLIAFAVLGILEGAGYVLFNSVLKIAPERMHAAWLVYQFGVVSTIFTIVGVPYDAVIIARENMMLLALLGIIEALLKLSIACFVLYIDSDKLIIYGMLTAFLSIVLLSVRVIYCHVLYQECTLAPHIYLNGALFRDMSAFAGWSLLETSTNMLANYGQGIILNKYFGAVVNAAQGISNQVSGQVGALATTMMRALSPMIDKSEGTGNRKLMLAASIMGSKMSFVLVMIFCVPLSIEMPYIFSFWLKEVPDYAVIFCRLLLVRKLIEQLYLPLTSSISAVGNIRKFKIWSTLLNVLPLIFSYYIFNKGVEPYVMYLFFIVYSILMLCVNVRFANLECGLSISSYASDVLLRCILAVLVFYFISSIPTFILEVGLTRLIFVIVLSAVFFMPIVWFVVFSNNDRVGVSVMINKISKLILLKSNACVQDRIRSLK
jgi:O-antigen/teichoic acid export membrane protein